VLVIHLLHAGKPGSVSAGGKAFDVTPDMVTIKRVQKKLAGRNFVPSVIEPSFGIGRILYCIFEHSYYTREVSLAAVPLCLFLLADLLADPGLT
jgi:glycyl-tRNA synthetase (class II)